MRASIEVVVVLPWVPETAIVRRKAVIAASSSARRSTERPAPVAATTSTLVGGTALEMATSSAPSTCSGAWPTTIRARGCAADRARRRLSGRSRSPGGPCRRARWRWRSSRPRRFRRCGPGERKKGRGRLIARRSISRADPAPGRAMRVGSANRPPRRGRQPGGRRRGARVRAPPPRGRRGARRRLSNPETSSKTASSVWSSSLTTSAAPESASRRAFSAW